MVSLESKVAPVLERLTALESNMNTSLQQHATLGNISTLKTADKKQEIKQVAADALLAKIAASQRALEGRVEASETEVQNLENSVRRLQ